MKKKLKICILVGLLVASIQIFMIPSNSLSTLETGYYQESVFNQGVNLTISVSDRYLKWDTILAINLTVRGTTNELLPNSTISLDIKTVSFITFIANISRPYYLWDSRRENVSLPNGTTEFSIPIVHVPTQQPYTLKAIFLNNTQVGPNITFPIFIESLRSGFVSFEGFIGLYFGAIVVVCVILILLKSHRIQKESNIPKDL